MFLFGGRNREQQSRGLLVPESSTIPGQSQFIQSMISVSGMESLGQGWVAEGIHSSLFICGHDTLLSGSLRVHLRLLIISSGPELGLTSLLGFFESPSRSHPWPGGDTMSNCLLHGPWAKKIFMLEAYYFKPTIHVIEPRLYLDWGSVPRNGPGQKPASPY